MRKIIFLSLSACLLWIGTMAQADEIDAIRATQGKQTNWFSFGDQNSIIVSINDAGNPEFPNKTYSMSNGNLLTEFGTAPITFTLTDKTAGQYATICLPQPIASVSNAVLYKISYGDVYEVHFVEETNYAADPAGTPYLVQAINDGDIVFTMTNATPVTDPVGVEAANGFVASLKDENQPIPVGYEYLLVSGGQLHSAGPGCLLSKNHAYIDVHYVPETEPVVPGAPRRVTLYNAEVQSPTGNPSIHHSNNSSLKMIKDGQLMIVRDGRMYTIMGVEE